MQDKGLHDVGSILGLFTGQTRRSRHLRSGLIKPPGCVVRRATCRALALGRATDSTGRTRKASQKGGTLAKGLKGGVGVCQMKQVKAFSAEV